MTQRTATDGSVVVSFLAEIRLDADEIAEARGDLKQAVQNAVGASGAVVADCRESKGY